MKCPKGCDFTMYEIDDCGDGSRGYECGMCGAIVSVDDEPCPKGDDCGDGSRGYECGMCGAIVSVDDEPCPKGVNGEPCCKVDGPHGWPVCLMCERYM